MSGDLSSRGQPTVACTIGHEYSSRVQAVSRYQGVKKSAERTRRWRTRVNGKHRHRDIARPLTPREGAFAPTALRR